MTALKGKTVLFEDLVRDARNCDLCPRMRSSSRIFGGSSGQIDAPLMFVGEAPGRLGADDTAIPFHGDRSGDNFEKLISQVGITRYECFITNAVLCNPKDDKGNNATPSKPEVQNCCGFLKRQIDLVDPGIVVTLGGQALHALRAIAPHDLDLAGAVRKRWNWYGRSLIPLYHPGQRAMLHRSFLNQLADYRFVAEQLRKTNSGKRRRPGGITNAEVATIARMLIEESGSVSYFRLHKLFYLAEYHSVRERSQRLTSSYVVRQKDGPYFTELHLNKLKKAIPDLVVTSEKRGPTLMIGSDCDLFSTAVQGRSELGRFITRIVRRYQSKTDEQLKTAVYLTTPMRTMLRKEKYEGASLFNSPIDMWMGVRSL